MMILKNAKKKKKKIICIKTLKKNALCHFCTGPGPLLFQVCSPFMPPSFLPNTLYSPPTCRVRPGAWSTWYTGDSWQEGAVTASLPPDVAGGAGQAAQAPGRHPTLTAAVSGGSGE